MQLDTKVHAHVVEAYQKLRDLNQKLAFLSREFPELHMRGDVHEVQNIRGHTGMIFDLEILLSLRPMEKP